MAQILSSTDATRVGLAALLLALFAAPLCGAGAPPTEAKAGTAATGDDARAGRAATEAETPEGVPGVYGRTPDRALPFRDFQQPYHRFFQRALEFLGGRTFGTGEAPADRIRVGFFGPTGEAPDGDVGEEMLAGVRLAVEEANAKGGAHGLPIELVVRPDSGLWGASSNVMAAFEYDDDVCAVIGSIDGANTHIALRVALKIGLPMVCTGATDPTLTETRIPWLLRCMADDRQQGYALARVMFDELDLKSVAAFRSNDRFGRTGIAEFRDAARRYRRPLRAELRWNRGERDFSRQIERLAKLAPEAIVLWGSASDGAAVVRALRAALPSVRLFGCDRLASERFVREAGAAAEGVTAAATFDPTRSDPVWQRFRDAYQERNGHRPDAFAAHAYDGARILIDVLRRTGADRAAIRDGLNELREWRGVTGFIPFDTTLNDVGPIYCATVRGGALEYREIHLVAKSDLGDEGNERPVAETLRPEARRPYRRMADAAPEVRSVDDGAARSAAAVSTPTRIAAFVPRDAVGQSAVTGMREALAARLLRDPDARPIELVVVDGGARWGRGLDALVDALEDPSLLAVVGSVERRGTHTAEMLAAKLHFPLLPLAGSDASVTAVPLPWVFSLQRADTACRDDDPRQARRVGHDAMSLLARRIREGGVTRRSLRDALARGGWFRGCSGTFRFDALGNRQERVSLISNETGRDQSSDRGGAIR